MVASTRGTPFFDQKTILFRNMSFMLILCGIWLTLGSLLAPVGSLLAPAGSLLAPFWLPLGPFWLTFGVPWLTFGALSFTFAHPGLNSLTFAVSCLHFSYLLEFHMKNIMQNLSCQRQKFRSGPLKGGLEEKIYFLLGCVRCASRKYDLNNREDDFRNLFGLLLELTFSFCLFWSACLCQTDQSRSQSRLKKAKEIM